MPCVLAKPPALLLLASSIALMGCSKSSQDAKAAAAAAAAKPAVTAAAAKSGTVAAVSLGKPGAAVDLRFDVGARPAVGVPLQINLELTPRSAVSQLHATVVANDGLDLVGTGDLDGADRPAVDVAVSRSISVTPQREGIFNLSVFVETDDGLTRSFAIPLIVGDAGAAAVVQKTATKIDATQQRVESLPAQESTRPR